MKNLKKISVFFILVLLVCLFSACNQNNTASEESKTAEITSVSDLDGLTLGCEEGASFLDDMKQRFPNSEIIENGTTSDSIQSLRSKRIDAFFADEPMARQQIKTVRGLRMLEEPITHDQYGFMLNLNNTELCNKINDLLDEYRQNGVFDKLKEKWIDSDKEPSFNAAQNWNGENGVLRVALAPDSAPFAYMIGRDYVGYDVELMYMIAQRLGYKLELIPYEFSTLVNGVSSGKEDIAIGCITYTPERAETVLFTQGTYYSGAVAVLLDDENSGTFIENLKASFERTFIREKRWQIITDGLLVTIKLSFLTLIFGSILGLLFSFMLRSQNRLVKGVANTLASVLDGLPLLIILMVFYYIVFAKTTLLAIFIGVVGLSLDFANTVAGILNTGVAAVDKRQIEAAESMGYPKIKIFTRIIFPQALNFVSSQYTGSIIGMVKGTSILGYITVVDLAKAGDLIRSRTYEAFFPLLVTAVIYYVLIRFIIFLLEIATKNLNPKNRKRVVKGVEFCD